MGMPRKTANDAVTDVRELLDQMLDGSRQLPEDFWDFAQERIAAMAAALVTGDHAALAVAAGDISERLVRARLGEPAAVPAPPRVREMAVPLLHVLRLAGEMGTGGGPPVPSTPDLGRRIEVEGLKVEREPEDKDQVVLLLREVDGARRVLPIWIGRTEATVIAWAQAGVVTDRPHPHDLIGDVVGLLDARIDYSQIVALKENVFQATLTISGRQTPARPSDAVIVCFKAGAPIYASEAVLAEAAVDLATD